jgi:hypothetical protein
MQYETCRHVKPDGAFCGSPALNNRKYCYYHLECRGRRLRRARALRDRVPYRVEIPPLDDLGSMQLALSEIVQALGAGQLDHRTGGKMLYAIQQAASLMKFRAKLEAAQPESQAVPQVRASLLGANLGSPCDHVSRVHEYPGFEQEFGINPGTDVDAETARTLRKADEEAELRQADVLPAPPLGPRLSPVQFRVYREEAYQVLNMQLNDTKRQLREYREMNQLDVEKLKKEMMSAAPPPERQAESA